MALFKLGNINVTNNRAYIPQYGDIVDFNGRQYTWSGVDWICVQTGSKLAKPYHFMDFDEEQSKPWRMIDELKGESTDDVIETLLLVLMKNGLIKDVFEFKEILQANKLANKLEK